MTINTASCWDSGTRGAGGQAVPLLVPAAPNEQLPASLRRLIAKYDSVERDRRNRALGLAGEEFVVELEHRQLAGSGRQDLSRRVRIADEEGDGAGYDVLSFAPTGQERLLEVKTRMAPPGRRSSCHATSLKCRGNGRRIGGSIASTSSPRRPASSPCSRR